MKAVGAALLSFMAGPALALSCMAPDVAHTFKELQSAPQTYVVVHGVLDFDPAKMPEDGLVNPSQDVSETRMDARLNGNALNVQGFAVPFNSKITLNVECIWSWCPSPKAGSSVLAFVEVSKNEHVFNLGPCYFTGFFNPDQATLNKAAACFRGEACEPRLQ
ncbi:MAG: hypothetical protein AAF231_03905 [Pseudomonadota bacterium]